MTVLHLWITFIWAGRLVMQVLEWTQHNKETPLLLARVDGTSGSTTSCRLRHQTPMADGRFGFITTGGSEACRR